MALKTRQNSTQNRLELQTYGLLNSVIWTTANLYVCSPFSPAIVPLLHPPALPSYRIVAQYCLRFISATDTDQSTVASIINCTPDKVTDDMFLLQERKNRIMPVTASQSLYWTSQILSFSKTWSKEPRCSLTCCILPRSLTMSHFSTINTALLPKTRICVFALP
jgi:hypothetical protein